MADLSKITESTLAICDVLDDDLADDEVVTDIVLLIHTKNAHDDESLYYRASTPSYLVQYGIVAWAHNLLSASGDERPIQEDEE
jgi:hypothetical protein